MYLLSSCFQSAISPISLYIVLFGSSILTCSLPVKSGFVGFNILHNLLSISLRFALNDEETICLFIVHGHDDSSLQ